MSAAKATSVTAIPAIVAACRDAYKRNALLTVPQRKTVIRGIVKLVQAHERDLVAATKADLGKPAFETKVMELGMVLHEAFNALDHLEEWVGPQKVAVEGVQRLDTNYVKHDPLGVVLIIGAWNYPLQLTLVGLVGAIAGGNTVVLKPSEVSPNCSRVLRELLPKYIPPEIVAIVEGGVPETTALLKERFDHILYTGNSRVAKIIMEAAAKHLTPVTLELGGKSPCVVDSNVDFDIAARRIMWGRMCNCGQTCIAPDYVLVRPSDKQKLIDALGRARTAFMGSELQKCEDYARIINDMHYERVTGLLKGGRVVLGGETDKATRFIAPTVLDDVDLASPLMTDEIFGPLLPLIPYSTKDDAVEFINQREKPLALYVFSKDKQFARFVEDRTSSGAFVVNDTLMHAAVAGLPFGGVGHSGMGAYHGRHTFNTFTHRKAVLKRDLALEFVNAIRYPPYTERNYNILMFLVGRTKERSPWMAYALVAAAVLTVVAIIQQRWK
jgi:aldehyde dehydrogenase (NAD+)